MATVTSERVWTGRPLRETYGDFAWRRPTLLSREMILEAGSETLASLRWDKWYSFDAVAESADGRWRLHRRRLISVLSSCVVTEAATGAEVATFQRNWRSTGEVRFASGSQFHWGFEGFWRRTYFWADGSGTQLMTMRSVLGFGLHRYEMSVDPAARSLAELPVLVMLGGYVMAMLSRRRHSS